MSTGLLKLYGSEMSFQEIKLLLNSLKDPRLKFDGKYYQELVGELFGSVFDQNNPELWKKVLEYVTDEATGAKNR